MLLEHGESSAAVRTGDIEGVLVSGAGHARGAKHDDESQKPKPDRSESMAEAPPAEASNPTRTALGFVVGAGTGFVKLAHGGIMNHPG